jgi:N-acetylglucosamine repressor
MKKKYYQITSINPKVGRNINKAIILNAIREQQPISRTQISQMTGLNKSTVSNIVSTLFKEELLQEEVSKSDGVGRNPLELTIKRERNFVGAIYVDSEHTSIAIVDVDGTIINKTVIETETQNPRNFILRCLNSLEKIHLRPYPLRGIGITIAGIVDSVHSRVVYSSNLGWRDLDIGAIVQEYNSGNEDVTIENDAKASALAELTFGKYGVTSRNFIFLSIGRGIGAGIVFDNHILSGSSHAAGEYGHMTLIDGGEQCSCGNKGCWEMYASDRATINYFSHLSGSSNGKLTMDDLVALAIQGNSTAQSALRRSAEYLGLGIANIIRTIDPQDIVIGGSVVNMWDTIYPVIMNTVNKRGFFGKQHTTLIHPTSLVDSPPLLGAAALSIRKIFTDFRIAL